MATKFTYHPLNLIYIDDIIHTYTDFKIAYPDFPIIKDNFFSYSKGDLYNLVNIDGIFNYVKQDFSDYQDLINAILNIED